MGRTSVRLTKTIQINKIGNEKEYITTDTKKNTGS